MHTSLNRFAALTLAAVLASPAAHALTTVTTPYLGITYTTRLGENVGGRTVNMRVLQIDLSAPGIGFKLTGAGGSLDTVRQSTLGFLNQENAQFAVNSHFFLPFPSTSSDANLVGFAASQGSIISGFEAPVQSYAIVTNAPAINIAPNNSASIVHADPNAAGGRGILENVTLGNSFAGSAQIITNGVVSIPEYKDATHPDGLLTPPGPANYSNANSWYNLFNARNAIGLSANNSKLVIFTVDNAGGSQGLQVGQVANIMLNDYGVFNALNMDGGGSTTLAMRDPLTGLGSIANTPSDTTPGGRLSGSNLAIFAIAVPEPTTYALMLLGLGMLTATARRRAA
jgi:Phosphodiester glycosidase/PEP-CTERM motif